MLDWGAVVVLFLSRWAWALSLPVLDCEAAGTACSVGVLSSCSSPSSASVSWLWITKLALVDLLAAFNHIGRYIMLREFFGRKNNKRHTSLTKNFFNALGFIWRMLSSLLPSEVCFSWSESLQLASPLDGSKRSFRSLPVLHANESAMVPAQSGVFASSSW